MNLPRVALALALSTLITAPAAAQDDSESTGALSTTSTITTSTAVCVGGIFLTMVAVTPTKRASIQEFLRQNHHALAQDLATGSGPTAQDLAALFSVPPAQRGKFTRALRAERALLSPALKRGTFETRDTDQVIAAVFLVMERDEALSDAAAAARLDLQKG
jgi:hypothetical protein